MSPRDALGRSLRYGDVHRLRLDWPRDESGHGRAPNEKSLADLEALAKRLGLQFSQLAQEDLVAFKAVSQTEWSFGWAGDIVQATKNLRDAMETLIRRRQAFVGRIGLFDAGEKLDETRSIADIAAALHAGANLNLRFAFGPDSRETISTLEKALDALTAYQARAAALPAKYPLDELTASQLHSWVAERAAAYSKSWPMRPWAIRKLRKSIWTTLKVGKAAAPNPVSDLDLLLPLAEQRQVIANFSKLLPDNSPWNGMETDPNLAGRALQAGRRLRQAANALGNFDRGIAETHNQLIRVLSEDRENLNAGMPIAAAAEAFRSAYEAFEDQLTKFREISGALCPLTRTLSH